MYWNRNDVKDTMTALNDILTALRIENKITDKKDGVIAAFYNTFDWLPTGNEEFDPKMKVIIKFRQEKIRLNLQSTVILGALMEFSKEFSLSKFQMTMALAGRNVNVRPADGLDEKEQPIKLVVADILDFVCLVNNPAEEFGKIMAAVNGILLTKEAVIFYADQFKNKKDTSTQ